MTAGREPWGTGPIELVELGAAGEPVRPTAPISRRGFTPRLLVSGGAAIIATVFAVAVLTEHRVATVAKPSAPPLPAPAVHTSAPFSPGDAAVMIAAICPVSCTPRIYSAPELAGYLVDFRDVYETRGALLVDVAGRPLGRAIRGVTSSGADFDLIVRPATGDPPLGTTTQKHPGDGSIVTITTRRGGWDLLVSFQSDGQPALPFTAARDWLATSPLPG